MKNNNKTNIIIITDIPEKIGRLKEKYGRKTPSNYSIASWTLFGKDSLIKKITYGVKEINILKEPSKVLEKSIKCYKKRIPSFVGIFYYDLIKDIVPILYAKLIVDNILKANNKTKIIIVTSNKTLKKAKNLFFNQSYVEIVYLESKENKKRIISFLKR
jgi:hypothetical protein